MGVPGPALRRVFLFQAQHSCVVTLTFSMLAGSTTGVSTLTWQAVELRRILSRCSGTSTVHQTCLASIQCWDSTSLTLVASPTLVHKMPPSTGSRYRLPIRTKLWWLLVLPLGVLTWTLSPGMISSSMLVVI